MKKVFVLFTVVMLMAVMAWEKQSGKPVESEFLEVKSDVKVV